MKIYTFKKNDTKPTKYEPMHAKHWQRIIPASFKTDDVKEDMMQNEYNIKIGSALINNFEKYIDWLFFKGYSMSDAANRGKFKVANHEKDDACSVSHEHGRATLIFTSDTNSKKLTEYCDKHNAQNTWNDLYFVPMFGLNDYNNSVAENLINYWMQCNPDRHVVIFAKQIGARSFSVPQIDNVCIMINDPSFSSAVQKMCRNQTYDAACPNKIPNTYWFALNNLATPVQPLFELIREMREYIEQNKFNTKFVDTVDIFLEDDCGEIMDMKQMDVDPFAEYMKNTANTFYRLAENFNLVATWESRQKLYELFKILKDMNIDLSNVKTSNTPSDYDEKDAELLEETIFEGHSKMVVAGGINGGKKNKEDREVIDFTMHVKNIIIDVCIRYGKHKYQNFENFRNDFAESTNNELTEAMNDPLQKIYNELLKIKMIKG